MHAPLRRLILATFLGLACVEPAGAGDAACNAALARLDAFGEIRWLANAESAPPRAQGWRCDEHEGCRFRDRVGVVYQTRDGFIVDKELVVQATGRPLPWGLSRNDPPAVVRRKLSALSGLRAEAGTREGYSTVELLIPSCEAWIEVWFEPGGGIRSISLNAQP